MVCGAPQYWVSWGGHQGDRSDRIVPTGGLQDQVSHPPSLLRRLYPLGSGVSPCPSDLMLRRDVLLQIRGFEEQFVGPYQLYEDQAFLAKVYLAAPVYISSATWLLYRRHAESCVARVHREGKYHAVRRYFLAWLDRYLKDRDVADIAIWDALEQARRPYRYPTLLWRGSRRFVAQSFKRLAALSKGSIRTATLSVRRTYSEDREPARSEHNDNPRPVMPAAAPEACAGPANSARAQR